MEAYKERVIGEKNDLVDKIDKLQSFISHSPIHNALPEHDKTLLLRQCAFMIAYREVLGARIARFAPMPSPTLNPGATHAG